MTDATCPFCQIGKLRDASELRVIPGHGHSQISYLSVFSTCDNCDSALANREQGRKNKAAVLEARRLADASLTGTQEQGPKESDDPVRRVLRQIRQWDMLDATGDGPFWKREIDAALAASPVSGISESARNVTLFADGYKRGRLDAIAVAAKPSPREETLRAALQGLMTAASPLFSGDPEEVSALRAAREALVTVHPQSVPGPALLNQQDAP